MLIFLSLFQKHKEKPFRFISCDQYYPEPKSKIVEKEKETYRPVFLKTMMLTLKKKKVSTSSPKLDTTAHKGSHSIINKDFLGYQGASAYGNYKKEQK